RGARPHARLALVRGIAESRTRRRQRFRQLARPHAERPERDIEILELAPHERHRNPEALLDHLAVALRTAALPRETPDLRLHLGDQVLEPAKIRGRFIAPPFRARFVFPIQAAPARSSERRAPL